MNKFFLSNFAPVVLAVVALYPGAARAECTGFSVKCSRITDQFQCSRADGCRWEHPIPDDPPSAPTVLPDTRIRIRNSCSRPVMVSVADGIGGFNTPPTQLTYIAPGADSAPLIETSKGGFYYYGETVDVDDLKITWEGTAARSMISNNGPREYGFHFMAIDRRQRDFTLNWVCPGIQPFHYMALWMGPRGHVGVGLGNDPTTASANGERLCMQSDPSAGCTEYGLNDGQLKQWLVITGNEGPVHYYFVDPDHQTAITQAMNACFRSVPNCRILLEVEN